MRILSDFAEGRRFALTNKDIFFLRTFRNLLEKNVPREVSALGSENVLVFTDACYEPGHAEWPCGLGGVLFDGGRGFFFSLPIGEETRALLGEGIKKQIIFEVETLAALIAALLWKTFFWKQEGCTFC